MKNLINIETFLKIFSNNNYRLKLDMIVLEFFGLEVNKSLEIKINTKKDVILEFNILYEDIFIFCIRVKDTKNLFENSKKFYLNFSSLPKNRPYELIMPCYWNIYYKYKSSNLKKEKKLVQFAKIFTINNYDELKSLLSSLKIFNNDEINDIINMIKIEE